MRMIQEFTDEEVNEEIVKIMIERNALGLGGMEINELTEEVFRRLRKGD